MRKIEETNIKSPVVARVKDAIGKVDKNATIILFGSQARGESNKYSDWDFLILTDKTADEKFQDKIRDALFYVELDTEEVITSFVHSRGGWEKFKRTPLYENIQEDGVAL